MKKHIFITLSILFFLIGCADKKLTPFKAKELYVSKSLVITQITENSFIHTSYKQTQDFGYVPCNGLVVRDGNETILFDTPTNDSGSVELMNWIKNHLKCNIVAVIPTHFHDDCLGGLQAFHHANIPSYASEKTIELSKADDAVVPKIGFKDSLKLIVGNTMVIAKFFGEGHTKDNVVGYFPNENVMFGGCLLKELDANEGYLGDANIIEWSSTVKKVKDNFPNVNIVVPGHGKFGDKKLLDYTIQLFKKK